MIFAIIFILCFKDKNLYKKCIYAVSLYFAVETELQWWFILLGSGAVGINSVSSTEKLTPINA